MSGRDQAHLDPVAGDSLAIFQRLAMPAEVRAIARLHDRQGLGRGHHRAVAGAGVVGVAVGDDRPLHRPHGIDEEVSGGAVEPLRPGAEYRFRLDHVLAFDASGDLPRSSLGRNSEGQFDVD